MSALPEGLVVLVTGPTASGKSALAARLAQAEESGDLGVALRGGLGDEHSAEEITRQRARVAVGSGER